MKINCIGVGSMGSITKGNQSILIDDVLFDIGSGVVKKMESMKLYTKTVKYLVITHSHADHLVDLPNFLIGRSIRGENTELLYIICGKGIRKKIITLFDLCFGDGNPHKYDNFEEKYNVKFIELENGQSFEDNGMKLTAYDLKHGNCVPILGFVLKKEGKVVGYATDTILCDNVKDICKKSNIAFIDATKLVATPSHMALSDVVNLAKEYPNCKIYVIHRSDYDHNGINEVQFPEDGQIITL